MGRIMGGLVPLRLLTPKLAVIARYRADDGSAVAMKQIRIQEASKTWPKLSVNERIGSPRWT